MKLLKKNLFIPPRESGPFSLFGRFPPQRGVPSGDSPCDRGEGSGRELKDVGLRRCGPPPPPPPPLPPPCTFPAGATSVASDAYSFGRTKEFDREDTGDVCIDFAVCTPENWRATMEEFQDMESLTRGCGRVGDVHDAAAAAAGARTAADRRRSIR